MKGLITTDGQMDTSVLCDGIAGYPEPPYDPKVASNFILDHPGGDSLMCLSTNCVAYQAHRCAAWMTAQLGRPAAERNSFTKTAGQLRQAIHRHFWMPAKSTFGYFIHGTGPLAGKLDESQEGMGLAYAILFDVADASSVLTADEGLMADNRPNSTMIRCQKCSRRQLISFVWVTSICLITARLASAAEAMPTNTAPFLAAVRQFADQVLEHGRDKYGQPTPLFVDGLNVDTREPVKWKWADGKEWVLCNLANQQGLLRALDGLSRLTGEPRYKEAALEATRYAFDHLRYGTQNNGGLLAWGGHLAYNATDDVLAGNPGGTGRIHELKCFFPHYQLLWEANPKATQQLIENTWNGHILDWAILDFNRHGSPNKLGRLWQNEYRGGEVFFWGKGLTFHNAGSDFYFAAGMLTKLAGAPAPLVWAKRLSQRYVETRDPKTGLEGYQFSQCASAWCDDVGNIRGDRAQYQYGDDFKGHRVVEGTLFPCYGNTPQVEPQVGRLLLGEALGDQGRDFTRHAVEAMTAWGKSAYRVKDNTFIPMLTDGTSMEGYVCKKDGYFGPQGRIHTAGHPGPEHLWVYALAFRLSGDAFMWEMARNIAKGNGWGDIGESPKAAPQLPPPGTRSDPFLIMACLELYRAGGNAAFLKQAESIGRNLLEQRVRNGWFVPSQRHIYCRVANDESQALLHLAAALLGKPEVVPQFTGAKPFFHAEYGNSTGRVYDAADIYGKTR